MFLFFEAVNVSQNDAKSTLFKRQTLKDGNDNLVPNNKYYISNYFNKTEAEYFNITYLKYAFSHKFKTVKVEYNVVFYDKNDNIIAPSNLSLYENLHLICHIDMIEDPHTMLDSLGYNHKNKYYVCIEFFKMHEIVKFGVKLYQPPKDENNEDEPVKFSIIYLFTQGYFDLKIMKFENDDIFDPIVLNKKYINFARNAENKYRNQTLKLKKYYVEYPICTTKVNSIVDDNKWIFRNVYNHHFCACKGFNCLDKNVGSLCKFYFYLYILDNNRDLYEKTDYLFIDLYFKEIAPEDTYPVFREMAKRKLPVHYMTEREDIYNEYCTNETKLCLDVIKIDKFNYTMTGTFFENYIELFLKLRAVVSARGVRFTANVFFNTEYITYIYAGSGLYYFKPFVYMDFKDTLYRRFDKIVIPNSEKFISLVKSNGWWDDEIIKINLPRWEKYYKENDEEKGNNKTIVIYFNPRDLNKEKAISNLYMENIKALLKNKKLNRELKKKNVTIYMSFYYSYIARKNLIKKFLKNSTYIQVIEHEQVSDYLKNASLFVSDYSNFILDMIYIGNPIALYIPDIEEPNMTDIYRPECFDVIESLKNGTIEIENLCFTVEEIVDKIIFYINNNFKLDDKLKNFYDSFGFKKEKSIDKFIEYLQNIKT